MVSIDEHLIDAQNNGQPNNVKRLLRARKLILHEMIRRYTLDMNGHTRR